MPNKSEFDQSADTMSLMFRNLPHLTAQSADRDLGEPSALKKPDLDRMWETFLKVSFEDVQSHKHFQTLRLDLLPIISQLMERGLIDWFCFLLHDRNSGVPTDADDPSLYLHLRFSVRENVDPHAIIASLPEYFIMTRQIERNRVESIAGIDNSLLKQQQIVEAWRVIGEQSEWLLDMLQIYREDVTVPPEQVSQFLHFFANMTNIRFR